MSKHSRGRFGRMTAAVSLTVPILIGLTAAPAAAAVVPAAAAQPVSDAITVLPTAATASYAPMAGPLSNGVGNAPLAGFPTNGSTFGVLTTGLAIVADSANTSPMSGTSTGTTVVRGTDTIYDLTTIRLDNIRVPGPGCTLSFKYKFLSEEFPEFVGRQYNDVFVAELDANSWTSSGGALTAPNAFATRTVNDGGMSAANALGTTYDGATGILTASTPVTAGVHTVFLSLGDRGDPALDSAVFVDELGVTCKTYPPGHITIHRFPLNTYLLASPSGWTCTDVNAGAVVTSGSVLQGPDATVECMPPAAANALCRSVVAGGYHAAAGTGTLEVTSSCSGLSVTQAMTLPFDDPGVKTVLAGSGTFPWRCATDDSQISRDADYWVFCQVNIP